MALSDIIRNGLALADSLTADLQPSVMHAAWTGNNGFGGDTYTAAIARPALVERKQKLIRTADDREILSSHVVSFLRPIAANGTAGRQEPIDPRDKLTLPDGSIGTILSVDAFIDRATGAGYFHQVYLG